VKFEIQISVIMDRGRFLFLLLLRSASYLGRLGLLIATVCRIENKCKYSLMTVILADLMTVWK